MGYFWVRWENPLPLPITLSAEEGYTVNLRALRDPLIFCPSVYTQDRTRDL